MRNKFLARHSKTANATIARDGSTSASRDRAGRRSVANQSVSAITMASVALARRIKCPPDSNRQGKPAAAPGHSRGRSPRARQCRRSTWKTSRQQARQCTPPRSPPAAAQRELPTPAHNTRRKRARSGARLTSARGSSTARQVLRWDPEAGGSSGLERLPQRHGPAGHADDVASALITVRGTARPSCRAQGRSVHSKLPLGQACDRTAHCSSVGSERRHGEHAKGSNRNDPARRPARLGLWLMRWINRPRSGQRCPHDA